jgi:hypothetical protein
MLVKVTVNKPKFVPCSNQISYQTSGTFKQTFLNCFHENQHIINFKQPRLG